MLSPSSDDDASFVLRSKRSVVSGKDLKSLFQHGFGYLAYRQMLFETCKYILVEGSMDPFRSHTGKKDIMH